ncbi:MAG: hypothetical protein FWE70_03430 [Oscillospiraceae bacterium]|nr:hypothetical protein [Oscillospiraceae bacterium]
MPSKAMTHRERFLATMRFKPVDRPFYRPVPIGFWMSTYKKWRSEGHIKDAENYWDVSDSLGFDPMRYTDVGFGLCPAFKTEILEDDGTFVTYVNHEGIKMREYKQGNDMSMPEFLDFPVKAAEDFRALLPRLQLNEAERFPADWPAKCAAWAGRDVPLGMGGDRYGGFYGPLRNYMGMEGLAFAYHDDPALVGEMVENRVELMLAVIERALRETTIDWFIFWEDMCYNHASLISPALFRKHMSPAYKKVTDFLRSKGVDVIFVDSDGHVDELIPLWLDAGVNGVYPMEVQSGSDVVRYRSEYGKELLMIGGIDKKALLGDRKDVLGEILRVAPVVERGGYIPGIDHSVPPDVTFEMLTYYMKEMRSAFWAG